MPNVSVSYHPVPHPKLLVSYALARVEVKVVAIERNYSSGKVRVTSDNILRVRRGASLEEVEYAIRRASYDAPARFYCDPVERTIGVAHEFEDADCSFPQLLAHFDIVVAQSVPELYALRMN
jgi:hypothetical protein